MAQLTFSEFFTNSKPDTTPSAEWGTDSTAYGAREVPSVAAVQSGLAIAADLIRPVWNEQPEAVREQWATYSAATDLPTIRSESRRLLHLLAFEAESPRAPWMTATMFDALKATAQSWEDMERHRRESGS